MDDERIRQPAAPLFQQSTSRLAGDVAARSSPSRRHRILYLLQDVGPLSIWEIAERLQVHEHQISGRFSELQREGLLVITGERRQNPRTGCQAEVYALAGTAPAPKLDDLPDYPTTLRIGTEGDFDREPLLSQGDLPGIPYARRGGVRELWRVALVECPGCGKPLKCVNEGNKKLYRCGMPTCRRTWELMLVNEPGRTQILALIGKTV